MIWVVVGLAAAAAGFVQTITGFGAVVLMMLALPFFFGIIDASALALLISMILCVVLCWQYRRHLCLRTALLPTLTYAAVNLLVLQVVDKVDAGRLELVFAVFLMLLSAYYLLVAKRVRMAPKPVVGVACGVLSGVSSAFFAIGGPPMALYFVAAAETYTGYAACMQFLFLITTATGLLGRLAGGLLRISILPYAAVGTVCILGGMQLGKVISERLDPALLRTLAYLFVGVSGAILLAQNLL